MVSLFLLLGCNLSYIVDLFAALHELASANALTLLKLASSVRALLKPQVAQARYMSSSMWTFALLRDSSDLHIYKDLYGERSKPEKKRKITVELQ